MAHRALLCVLVLAFPLSLLNGPARSAEPKPSAGANAKTEKDAKTKKGKTSKDAEAEYYELYKVFADTLDQVERNYVKDVSRRELMEAAIRGVLGKLDPYSNYISPDELSRFKTSVESQFGGIGIQITIENGQLKVLSPLVGSPAYKAGLQAGDAITKIEDESTDNITIDEAVRRLKGEAGTSVTITIVHPRGTKEETMTIPREIIRLDTIMGDARDADDQWDFMLDHEKHIGYIRLTSFSRDTARDLQKAMAELQKQGLKGLILDLRFNPGGLLTSAIEISDMFVAEGRIVSTSGRNSPERAWEARKEGTFEGFPIAMLVNRYSASASEIFSACLQDHHRAVIIGERTWGKGSVQNVIELEEGRSALKLTTASYLRPNGHNIHRFPDSKESDEWGVMPDKGYEVKLSDAEMGELVRYRRDKDILLINHSAKEEEPAKTEPSKEEKSGDKPSGEKPSDKKTEKPKSPEKSSDTTPTGDKPATDKPAVDKPATEKEKPAGDKPAEKPAKEKPSTDKPATKAGFVDRQLEKALDYLSSELARAN
jgi:carboxyl-terminal processing protease